MVKTQEQIEKLVQAAYKFQEKSLESRKICRENYYSEASQTKLALHILIDGQISLFAEQMQNRIDSINPETSYQIGLTASFIRTHFIICELILNSDLLEAAILIRKQLESLVRLHELDSNSLQSLTGKVPQLKHLPKLGKMYGELSDIAHFLDPKVSQLLHSVKTDNDVFGPNILSQYSKKSSAFFKRNCIVAAFFIGWLTNKLPTWYVDYDNTVDILTHRKIVELMLVL